MRSKGSSLFIIPCSSFLSVVRHELADFHPGPENVAVSGTVHRRLFGRRRCIARFPWRYWGGAIRWRGIVVHGTCLQLRSGLHVRILISMMPIRRQRRRRAKMKTMEAAKTPEQIWKQQSTSTIGDGEGDFLLEPRPTNRHFGATWPNSGSR